MRTTNVLFAAVTLLTSTVAFGAEPGSADVGRFVYDGHGAIVGSLVAIGPQGNATISDGLLFHPGYHLVTVPASTLSIQGGRVVLTGMSVVDLGAQAAEAVAAR